MRGKAETFAVTNFFIGITPAYAGKSLRKQNEQRYFEDHPRLCGEKSSMTIVFFLLAGSPPPMRGKASRSRRFCSLTGITPAYAGKREVAGLFSHLRRDHPRLCGEKIYGSTV